LQDIAGGLSEDLTTKEADTLAGYWIEHTPKFKLVILFTRDAEDIIKPYLQKYKELSSIIEVGTAKYSLAELESIQEEVASSAESMGIPVDSAIDVYKNCVKVYVAEQDRTKLNRVLSEGKLVLPDCVEVETIDSLAEPVAYIYGGLSLSTCTSGFAVKNSSGTKGITTAAHCSNSQSYSGTSLPFQSQNHGTYYDIQWHTAPGFTVTNKIKTSSSNIMNITATKSRSQQWVGALVYKYGKTTGRTAGYIKALNYRPSSDLVPNPQATFIWVDDTAGYSPLCENGDSGGPWFTAYTAWGSTCFKLGGEAIYMAINYVSGIGVSVMTSP